jgi:hypothetical protein
MTTYVFVADRRDGLQHLANEVASTPEGNRNHILYWATIRAAEEGYDPDDIHAAMTDAAASAGLERREAWQTIKSGLSTATRQGLWSSRAETNGTVLYEWTAERVSAEFEAWQAKHPRATAVPAHKRHVMLTPAGDITPRRVRWLWDGRLAVGSVSLIGGREGQGKTMLSLELAALVTTGRLPGESFGTPRSVIVVTSEDAWDYTIVPRLLAAGADLARVYRAEVKTADEITTGLSLPHDFLALEEAIQDSEAALVILDPLLSRLDGNLDTHKDADVRLALEPLVALAGRNGIHLIGLIHVNKTATTDPLTSLMASRAFVAVARAVLFVMKDPEDDGVRLVGQPKNNLGRTDMETLRFEVQEVVVGTDPDDGKDITAPKMVWLDTTTRTVEDALMLVAQGGSKGLSKRALAGEWLVAYLQQQPDGRSPSSQVVTAGKSAGHGEQPIRRAREKLEESGELFVIDGDTFPRTTDWQLSARLMLAVPTDANEVRTTAS